jgi:hypothetical protein
MWRLQVSIKRHTMRITIFIAATALTGACARPTTLAQPSASGVSFKDITASAGLELRSNTFGAVFSDIDNDGDDDLLVSRHGKGPFLYLNRGDLTFEDVTKMILPRTRGDRHGVTVVDLDNDGDRDLVMAGGGADGVGKGAVNHTYRNLLAETGELAFELVTSSSGLGGEPRYRSRSLLPLASPDGTMVDLYLTCLSRPDFPNQYFRNSSREGKIRFETEASSSLHLEMNSEGKDIFVDIDRDGDQDFFVMDRQRLRFFRRGPESYNEETSGVSDARRVSSLAAGDLNNDGFPEIVVGTYPAWGISDQASHHSGHIHFVVYSLSSDFAKRTDSHDAMTFRTTGEQLTADLGFKPGLSPNDPGQIYLGADRQRPTSTKLSTTRTAASGAPEDTSAPGTYIWFDQEDSRWHVLWRHSPELMALRGSFHAEQVSDLELHDTEEKIPRRPTKDLIFLNQNGHLAAWPDGPELSHLKLTETLLVEDLDNNGYADIVGLRRGQPGGLNGDPFIVLNHGRAGLRLVEENDLQNADDDLCNADQLTAGFVNDDGLLDLFITNGGGVRPGSSGPFKLYLNTTSNDFHYLALELVGRRSNRDAIGAQVEVYGDEEDDQGEPVLLGYRELGSGYHRSQPTHLLHFGLGEETGPVKVKVKIRWPAGEVSWHELEADQRHRIEEPAG